MRNLIACRTVVGRLATVAALLFVFGHESAPAADVLPGATFFFKGAAQTWTVPPGVRQATFALTGAAGGEEHPDGFAGRSTRVTEILAVTPGEKLQINVGGRGGPPRRSFNQSSLTA